MIDYAWCADLEGRDAEQLEDLLVRAAAYDAEPEYNSVEFAEVTAAMADPDSRERHLLIWLQPRPRALDAPLEPRRVAGLFRFVPTADDWYEVTIVIDPELRSIGVMTLLMERVGRGLGEDGWLGSGIHRIRSWARGNHPASQRLADRNLVPRDLQIWKLIRPVAAADAATVLRPAAEVGTGEVLAFLAGLERAEVADTALLRRASHDLERGDGAAVLVLMSPEPDAEIAGVIGIDPRPVLSEEFGRCATVRYLLTADGSRVTMAELIVGSSAAVRAAGASALIVHVQSNDDELVATCRLTGFQHDRTDIRYELV